MWKSLALVLTLGLASQSCGDGPNACNEDNFCAVNESGSAACVDGYDWINPSASDDFRCEERAGLAVLGDGTNKMSGVNSSVVASSADGLNVPRDLGFNPTVSGQLWVVNQGDESMVIFENTASANQSSVKKRDVFGGGPHFLAQPSGLAFGANGNLSTIHETDQPTQGNSTPADFMGPTMWSSNLNVFNGGHSGHLDMMHNSPLGMGIAWETGNAYWVFDGYHSSLTRYDFATDHGPGGTIHDDGIVARYVEGQVKRVASVVSHMEVDHDAGMLYVADTGNNRVAVLDINSGTRGNDLPFSENYDCSQTRCSDYYTMNGATFRDFVKGADHGLTQPSGLAIYNGDIYVADYATGRIFAFTTGGELIDWLDTERPNALGGLEFDSSGNLYVADSQANEVLRIQGR